MIINSYGPNVSFQGKKSADKKINPFMNSVKDIEATEAQKAPHRMGAEASKTKEPGKLVKKLKSIWKKITDAFKKHQAEQPEKEPRVNPFHRI